MGDATRDMIMRMVAGMRAEKRAAGPGMLGAAMRSLRRGAQLLTGSRAKELERRFAPLRARELELRDIYANGRQRMIEAASTRPYAEYVARKREFDQARSALGPVAARATRFGDRLAREQQAVERFRNLTAGYGVLGTGAAYGGYRLLKPEGQEAAQEVAER